MLEVKAKSSFFNRIMWSLLPVLFIMVIGLVLKGNFTRNTILACFVFFLFLVIAFVAGTNIISIHIENARITVNYYYWLRRRNFQCLVSEVSCKIIQKTTFRGGKATYLQLFKDDKLIFEVDQRDGFEMDDFFRISEALVQTNPT